METVGIGFSIPRKESWDKVTGSAKYNDDMKEPGLLYAWMVTSPYAHANIKTLDTIEAWNSLGVYAVITGDATDVLCGPTIEDRPPIARGKVRYFGEPVAVVVANTEYEAKVAGEKIKIEYEELPVVNSITDALKPDAILVHENLGQYKVPNQNTYPEPDTNIANRSKIKKGDMQKGWTESKVIVEESCSFPQSYSAPMETRSAKVEIKPDGRVIVTSTNQGPFSVRKDLSKSFHIDKGKIIVNTPLLGGGFGGKATVQLEFIAYLASKAVNGRLVMLANTREQDMTSSPVHIGLDAKVKLGATKDGKITAAEITYMYDCGAYTDSGPKMSRVGAVNGTGPYNIENVWIDSLCVYTNHPYVTAFRGFGHPEFTTAIERTMDKLAFALGMDPIELRMKNAIGSGNATLTQYILTNSSTGNLQKCLQRVRELIKWAEGQRVEIGDNKVRAKGISCFWKTSSSPTNAVSGVLLIMNPDGTINLNCGAVEMGNSTKTTVAQILAEKMKMHVDQIHVTMEVDTQTSPIHWKTVASMTTYMVGNAVLDAAEDLIRQIKNIAAIALRSATEQIEVAKGTAYIKNDPSMFIEFKDIALGYEYPNGNSIGGQIMGRGTFIMHHLTPIDKETGKGRTGPTWTVGAQAVEVEFDKTECTYRVTKAASVIDAGKLLNPKAARGIVMGGMCMGLGWGSREAYEYTDKAVVKDTSFRTYKMMRAGEQPIYEVDFIESPDISAPYGARPFGEHGIIGMAGALMNSLSSAAEVDLNKLPLTPEYIWKSRMETGK